MLSVHEPTWDSRTKMHTCCGSKHSYHNPNCIVRNNMIPGRSSDPIFMKVQAMKYEGMTSSQIAKSLAIPLDQVNELWLP